MDIITQHRETQQQLAHIRRIRNMNPTIDTSPPSTLTLKHLTTRPKKQQLIDDRRQEIAKENRKLMENMAKILSESRMTEASNFKLKSINETQRKQAITKLNMENKVFYERLNKIRPMIKKDDFQKEYEQNKLFHSRRKKHVPFGVHPILKLPTKRKTIPQMHHHINMTSSSAGSYHSNEEGRTSYDSDGDGEENEYEQESFLKQYHSMNDVFQNKLQLNSSTSSTENPSKFSIITPNGIQSVADFRRQIIASKKQQNNLEMSSSLSYIHSSSSNTNDSLKGDSFFQFSHDPDAS